MITFVTATRWNPTLEPVTSKFSPFTSTACASVSQGPGTFQSAAVTDLSVHASLLSQVLNDGLVGNLIKLKYIVLITTFKQHGINRIQHKSSRKETGYWHIHTYMHTYIHTYNLRRGIQSRFLWWRQRPDLLVPQRDFFVNYFATGFQQNWTSTLMESKSSFTFPDEMLRQQNSWNHKTQLTPTTDQQHTHQFTSAGHLWTKHEFGYLSGLVMTGRNDRLE